jgi:hypothetical protein
MPSNVSTANYIYRMGTAPNTRAAVSQKNKIYGYATNAQGFQQIGVISEFGFDESRTIDPVRGVGFGDQIAELVPSVTEPMTLTLNKTLLYTANLFQVLGYKGGIDGLARSLRHHRWPFDIKQELVFSEVAVLQDPNGTAVQARVTTGPTGADNPIVVPKALLTFFEGCWLNSYSASFTADAAMVAENASVTVTDIIDGISQYGEFIDTGLAPIQSNGGPGKGFSLRFANSSNNNTAGLA